jgi:hypothetical protein
MDNLLLKQQLTPQQLQLLQSEMDRRKKSKGVAYLLWFLLGGIGGHRYYVGDIGMGIGMTLTLGGFGLWALIDVFFIGSRVEKKNLELEREIIEQVKLTAPAEVTA